MFADHKCVDRHPRHIQLSSQKLFEARKVQHSTHPEHSFLPESCCPKCHICHRIHRVCNHNDFGLRCIFCDFLRNGLHDSCVFREKIHPGHPRFSSQTSSNDDDIRSFDRAVIVRSDYFSIDAKLCSHMAQIKRFAFGKPGNDIHKSHVVNVSLDQNHCKGASYSP